MSKLNDIVSILDLVSPPHRLLTAYDDHYIPLYSLQAFQDLDKPFHMGVWPMTNDQGLQGVHKKVYFVFDPD